MGDKSKQFAVRIIKFSKFLNEERREYMIAKQIVRSGTCVGANIRESKNAQSDTDFVHKLSLALKEADECTDMNFSTKEYFVRETYKSIRRNGFMSIASISTVAVSLMVLGIFLLMFLNTNNLAQHLEKQVQVGVYMQDDASQDELDAMKVKLEKMNGVVKVTPISKKEALERFKERLGDQQKILESLGGDNPFPNSFDVQVKSPDVIKEITNEITKMPKVETARFGQGVVRPKHDACLLLHLSLTFQGWQIIVG